MSQLLSLLTSFAVLFSCFTVQAQQQLSGSIRDSENNMPIPGVIVLIKESQENTISDAQGDFQLSTTHSFPMVLQFSLMGYSSKEISVKSNKRISVSLKSNEIFLGETRVTASRLAEKQKASPLTMETLDIIAIRETPAASFYEGLAQLKGVDLTSASLGFKVINTRGFNSTSPVRSLQIIDGVDNQSPGLNFSLGNFLGASELDIQRVDIIQGASSAYYGPNAFNGVISMVTQSPFSNPGLQLSFKGGERNLLEGALRWAQVFKNKKGEEKFGYKINVYGMQARDWMAENYAATPQSRSKEDNPGGYDAVNIYGDEYISGTDYTTSAGSFPGLGVYYRRGYKERDLVDYNTSNFKAGLALHYKIKSDVEAVFASNFATGTTIYQGDNRYRLKDIQFLQNRIEVRKANKWFIRAYTTHEDAGTSYDAYFTALLLQRAAKSDGDFKIDYENFWNDHYNLSYVRTLSGFPQPPGPGPDYVTWLNSINQFLYENYYDSLKYWHNSAQQYASGVGLPQNGNSAFFEPGTYQFDTAFAGITSRKTFGENGSRFFDKSALYHAHAEYIFNFNFADLVTGSNFRLYRPNSAGTIFSDTNGVRLQNWEWGAYAGLEKKIWDDQLKINLTGRVDKNENFPWLFSPAASMVYNPKPNHYYRLSFSSAIRNPTLSDQYLYYQVGRAILIGNINGIEGLVTVPSLQRAFDLNKNFDTLDFFDVDPVRPEKVRTIEAGYRGTWFQKLYVDINAYFSRYRDFIGYKIGADIDTATISGPFGNYKDIKLNQVYRVATNSKDVVSTYGLTAGLNYFIGRFFSLSGNYSWNVLDRHGSTDPLIPAFNTPAHKINVGFSGRDIKNFGFSVNYRWVEGFRFEGSPQFTGNIPSYGLFDAQMNKRFPAYYTTLKVGVSNLLNNQHFEVYGGPLVGRLAYLTLLLELNPLKQ